MAIPKLCLRCLLIPNTKGFLNILLNSQQNTIIIILILDFIEIQNQKQEKGLLDSVTCLNTMTMEINIFTKHHDMSHRCVSSSIADITQNKSEFVYK